MFFLSGKGCSEFPKRMLISIGILIWSKDGTLLAEVDCYDMFGTRYPWIEDMKVAEDGSVMVLMTQDRDDDSASELMVFRLTGF